MIENLYKKYLACQYQVSTDSRANCFNTLFFALKGNRFNGNKFAEIALKKGASYVVIDEAIYYKDSEKYILVENGLKTLQDLATYHRKQFNNVPVLAITGSNGKTTTRLLATKVLSTKYKVVTNTFNFNNHIGVPLTLLDMRPNTEFLTIEMGANHVGEIANLCKIAQPNYGLITNLALAHLEGFGSFEGVLKAKSELYTYLTTYKGKIFVDSQCPLLMELAFKFFKVPILYPSETDFFYCKFIKAQPYITYQAENGEIIHTKMLGKHHFMNISAALCIGKYFKVCMKKANQVMSSYEPNDNRSQIITKLSNTIVLDAYNANPASMEAGILAFNALPHEKKILILGDMNELGQETIALHKKLGNFIKNFTYQQVFLCGKWMFFVKKVYPFAHYFKDKAGLIKHLAEKKFYNTAFFIKASSSLAFKDLVKFL